MHTKEEISKYFFKTVEYAEPVTSESVCIIISTFLSFLFRHTRLSNAKKEKKNVNGRNLYRCSIEQLLWKFHGNPRKTTMLELIFLVKKNSIIIVHPKLIMNIEYKIKFISLKVLAFWKIKLKDIDNNKRKT